MKLDVATSQWFSSCRDEWYRRIVPRHSEVFGTIPEVPAEAVSSARLFANRSEAIASLPKGGTVAEVGTLTGEFARVMWERLSPEALHVFDIRHHEQWQATNPDLHADPRVTFHLGDSSTCLSRLPDEHFDVIYIDGDHSEEGVRRDADTAIKKLKRNGVLVFDDYTPWSPLELMDYGVLKVVNELIRLEKWRVVYLALDPFMYCNIAIQRPVNLGKV